MKSQYLLFVLSFVFNLLFAQKEGNIWLLQNASFNKPVLIDWNVKEPLIYLGNKSKYGGGNCSTVSNKDGQLRYSSNGCAIMGQKNEVLPNGDTINPGDIWKSYCLNGGSYPSVSIALTLPMPLDTNRYFVFHTRSKKQDIDSLAWPQRDLFYSEINSSLNNGKGDVTRKNILIKSDTFYQGVYACRHANGQDWWVIVPQVLTLGFQRVLLTSKGVQYVGEQNIQANKFGSDTTKGQSNFSADGTKYVTGDPYNGIRIFDFDRCTGLFSNMKYIDIGFDQVSCVGVGFSPNSRFLYATHSTTIEQYDLMAKDIAKSKILIDTFDGFDKYTSFYECQLAPNNKIYVGSTSGTYYLGVIHHPDSLGKACGFKQHDLKLPEYYYARLPNIPNYRLGASDPNCALPIATNDNAKPELLDIKVFPNPTSGNLTISSKELPNVHCTWSLFNAQGQYIFSQLLHNETITLNLPSHLPKGIYFWRVADGVKVLQQGKLVLLD